MIPRLPHIPYERTLLHFTGSSTSDIFAELMSGENVKIETPLHRQAFSLPDPDRCDWCAELFKQGEKRHEGFTPFVKDTHRICAVQARRSRRKYSNDYFNDDPTPRWEPPEMNYPNGQGTYD